MKINILAFGIVKEIFGASSTEIELQDGNVYALKKLLEEKYPRLKQLTSYMVAVNNEYANRDRVVTTKDEVAIIPPVSGG
jgi:molybdopterin converting factor subunit 1